VAGLIKTFKRSRDMMKSISGGGLGAMRSLMSGKMDIFSAMSSGGGKFRSSGPRRRTPRKHR
jgi:signal recognition particle subunit SRP54